MARAKKPRRYVQTGFRPAGFYQPTRGAVVKLRDNRGALTNRRAIVLKKAKPTNFSRAYEPEVLVCEIYGDSNQKFKVARDAEIEGRTTDAARIYVDAVDISSKQVAMLQPVGRVKKIPKGCLVALKKSGEK